MPRTKDGYLRTESSHSLKATIARRDKIIEDLKTRVIASKPFVTKAHGHNILKVYCRTRDQQDIMATVLEDYYAVKEVHKSRIPVRYKNQYGTECTEMCPYVVTGVIL